MSLWKKVSVLNSLIWQATYYRKYLFKKCSFGNRVVLLIQLIYNIIMHSLIGRVFLISLLFSSSYMYTFNVYAGDPDIVEIILPSDSNSNQENNQLAREYFKRAESLFLKKKYKKAASEFVAAYEVSPHPSVLINIAICYDRSDMLPEATVYYQKYLFTEKDENARKRLDEIKKLVGEIIATCKLDNCVLRIDGIEKSEKSDSIVVIPGEHKVEVFIDDKLMKTDIIDVSAGDISFVVFDNNNIKPISTKSDTDTEEMTQADIETNAADKKHKTKLSPLFWIFGSTTLVSGGMIAVFGSLTLKNHREYQDSDGLDLEAQDDGKKFKLVTNLMIGTTGVLALATIIIGITDAKKKRNNVSLEIVPGPNIGIAGSF